MHDVGLLSPNPFGLYDLSGNASEWCGEIIHDRMGIVARGGSYVSNYHTLRSTQRFYHNGTRSTIGFRIAASINPEFEEIPTESPTATPTLPPTFTPTPTVTLTATHTPTPTLTPTPQPTLDPNQPPQEITIDLPGLPEGAVPLQLVWIPPGKFMMGKRESNNNWHSLHEVSITKGFYMGKYEVTNAQYRMYKPTHDSKSYYQISLNRDNQPAVYLNWNKTIDYCNWLEDQNPSLNFRIPTEAEWEYACRAGSTTDYYWGDNGNATDYSWSEDNSGNISHDVGQLTPNHFNLFDMSGNVFEWCNDWKENYPTGPLIDPIGPQTGVHKIVRGGSFSSSIYYGSSYARAYDIPASFTYGIGFRIAASIYEDGFDPLNTPTVTPTPTSTPVINIFTEGNIPDPYFREMIKFYSIDQLGDEILSIEPFVLTAQQATELRGKWDFKDVPGVGDADIKNLQGFEYFTKLCSIRANSSFTFFVGLCP